MKIFLYVVGWISLVVALLTLGEASSAVGQGVAATILVAAVVSLGAGAICARLEKLNPRGTAAPASDAFDQTLAASAAQARAERSPANAANRLPTGQN